MSFTRQQLENAIQDTMNVYEATMVANLGSFMRTAEERILKSLQLNLLRKNLVITTTASDAFVTLPTDFLAPYSTAVDTMDGLFFLQQKDLTFIQTVNPDNTDEGVPDFYAQYDLTQFILAPTPAAVYDLHLSYKYRPASLADAGDAGTTWLSVNARDCLLYGTLVEAAVFLKYDQAGVDRFEKLFTTNLARLKDHGEALEVVDQLRYGQVRGQRT